MKENLKSKKERTINQEFNEEMKFPFDEDDSLLEKKIFAEGDPDWLPKTRYIQAYTKYLKITKLAKKYKGQLSSSGRIKDLLKDCLNDMEMALELKFGKRGRRENHKWIPNTLWDSWMNELADIRNQAIHKFTIFRLEKDIELNGAAATRFYLRAIGQDGKGKETSEEVLPYLKKTLQGIKGKLNITEKIE